MILINKMKTFIFLFITHAVFHFVSCQTKSAKSSKVQWQASLGATGSDGLLKVNPVVDSKGTSDTTKTPGNLQLPGSYVPTPPGYPGPTKQSKEVRLEDLQNVPKRRIKAVPDLKPPPILSDKPPPVIPGTESTPPSTTKTTKVTKVTTVTKPVTKPKTVMPKTEKVATPTTPPPVKTTRPTTILPAPTQPPTQPRPRIPPTPKTTPVPPVIMVQHSLSGISGPSNIISQATEWIASGGIYKFPASSARTEIQTLAPKWPPPSFRNYWPTLAPLLPNFSIVTPSSIKPTIPPVIPTQTPNRNVGNTHSRQQVKTSWNTGSGKATITKTITKTSSSSSASSVSSSASSVSSSGRSALQNTNTNNKNTMHVLDGSQTMQTAGDSDHMTFDIAKGVSDKFRKEYVSQSLPSFDTHISGTDNVSGDVKYNVSALSEIINNEIRMVNARSNQDRSGDISELKTNTNNDIENMSNIKSNTGSAGVGQTVTSTSVIHDSQDGLMDNTGVSGSGSVDRSRMTSRITETITNIKPDSIPVNVENITTSGSNNKTVTGSGTMTVQTSGSASIDDMKKTYVNVNPDISQGIKSIERLSTLKKSGDNEKIPGDGVVHTITKTVTIVTKTIQPGNAKNSVNSESIITDDRSLTKGTGVKVIDDVNKMGIIGSSGSYGFFTGDTSNANAEHNLAVGVGSGSDGRSLTRSSQTVQSTTKTTSGDSDLLDTLKSSNVATGGSLVTPNLQNTKSTNTDSTSNIGVNKLGISESGSRDLIEIDSSLPKVNNNLENKIKLTGETLTETSITTSGGTNMEDRNDDIRNVQDSSHSDAKLNQGTKGGVTSEMITKETVKTFSSEAGTSAVDNSKTISQTVQHDTSAASNQKDDLSNSGLTFSKSIRTDDIGNKHTGVMSGSNAKTTSKGAQKLDSSESIKTTSVFIQTNRGQTNTMNETNEAMIQSDGSGTGISNTDSLSFNVGKGVDAGKSSVATVETMSINNETKTNNKENWNSVINDNTINATKRVTFDTTLTTPTPLPTLPGYVSLITRSESVADNKQNTEVQVSELSTSTLPPIVAIRQADVYVHDKNLVPIGQVAEGVTITNIPSEQVNQVGGGEQSIKGIKTTERKVSSEKSIDKAPIQETVSVRDGELSYFLNETTVNVVDTVNNRTVIETFTHEVKYTGTDDSQNAITKIQAGSITEASPLDSTKKDVRTDVETVGQNINSNRKSTLVEKSTTHIMPPIQVNSELSKTNDTKSTIHSSTYVSDSGNDGPLLPAIQVNREEIISSPALVTETSGRDKTILVSEVRTESNDKGVMPGIIVHENFLDENVSGSNSGTSGKISSSSALQTDSGSSITTSNSNTAKTTDTMINEKTHTSVVTDVSESAGISDKDASQKIIEQSFASNINIGMGSPTETGTEVTQRDTNITNSVLSTSRLGDSSAQLLPVSTKLAFINTSTQNINQPSSSITTSTTGNSGGLRTTYVEIKTHTTRGASSADATTNDGNSDIQNTNEGSSKATSMVGENVESKYILSGSDSGVLAGSTDVLRKNINISNSKNIDKTDALITTVENGNSGRLLTNSVEITDTRSKSASGAGSVRQGTSAVDMSDIRNNEGGSSKPTLTVVETIKSESMSTGSERETPKAQTNLLTKNTKTDSKITTSYAGIASDILTKSETIRTDILNGAGSPGGTTSQRQSTTVTPNLQNINTDSSKTSSTGVETIESKYQSSGSGSELVIPETNMQNKNIMNSKITKTTTITETTHSAFATANDKTSTSENNNIQSIKGEAPSTNLNTNPGVEADSSLTEVTYVNNASNDGSLISKSVTDIQRNSNALQSDVSSSLRSNFSSETSSNVQSNSGDLNYETSSTSQSNSDALHSANKVNEIEHLTIDSKVTNQMTGTEVTGEIFNGLLHSQTGKSLDASMTDSQTNIDINSTGMRASSSLNNQLKDNISTLYLTVPAVDGDTNKAADFNFSVSTDAIFVDNSNNDTLSVDTSIDVLSEGIQTTTPSTSDGMANLAVMSMVGGEFGIGEGLGEGMSFGKLGAEMNENLQAGLFAGSLMAAAAGDADTTVSMATTGLDTSFNDTSLDQISNVTFDENLSSNGEHGLKLLQDTSDVVNVTLETTGVAVSGVISNDTTQMDASLSLISNSLDQNQMITKSDSKSTNAYKILSNTTDQDISVPTASITDNSMNQTELSYESLAHNIKPDSTNKTINSWGLSASTEFSGHASSAASENSHLSIQPWETSVISETINKNVIALNNDVTGRIDISNLNTDNSSYLKQNVSSSGFDAFTNDTIITLSNVDAPPTKITKLTKLNDIPVIPGTDLEIMTYSANESPDMTVSQTNSQSSVTSHKSDMLEQQSPNPTNNQIEQKEFIQTAVRKEKTNNNVLGGNFMDNYTGFDMSKMTRSSPEFLLLEKMFELIKSLSTILTSMDFYNTNRQDRTLLVNSEISTTQGQTSKQNNVNTAIAPLNTANIDSNQYDTADKDSVTVDIYNKGNIAANSMNKDSITMDTVNKDEVALDTVTKDSVPLNTANKDSVQLDTINIDSVVLDKTRKDSDNLDNVKGEYVAVDTTSTNAVPVDTLNKNKDFAVMDTVNIISIAVDAPNNDSVTLNNAKEEFISVDTVTGSSVVLDTVTNVPVATDTVNKDTATFNTAKKDAGSLDAMGKRVITTTVVNKDSATLDAVHNDSVALNIRDKDSATLVTKHKDSGPLHTTHKNAVTMNTVNTDYVAFNTVINDSISFDATKTDLVVENTGTQQSSLHSVNATNEAEFKANVISSNQQERRKLDQELQIEIKSLKPMTTEFSNVNTKTSGTHNKVTVSSSTNDVKSLPVSSTTTKITEIYPTQPAATKVLSTTEEISSNVIPKSNASDRNTMQTTHTTIKTTNNVPVNTNDMTMSHAVDSSSPLATKVIEAKVPSDTTTRKEITPIPTINVVNENQETVQNSAINQTIQHQLDSRDSTIMKFNTTHKTHNIPNSSLNSESSISVLKRTEIEPHIANNKHVGDTQSQTQSIGTTATNKNDLTIQSTDKDMTNAVSNTTNTIDFTLRTQAFVNRGESEKEKPILIETSSKFNRSRDNQDAANNLSETIVETITQTRTVTHDRHDKHKGDEVSVTQTTNDTLPDNRVEVTKVDDKVLLKEKKVIINNDANTSSSGISKPQISPNNEIIGEVHATENIYRVPYTSTKKPVAGFTPLAREHDTGVTPPMWLFDVATQVPPTVASTTTMKRRPVIAGGSTGSRGGNSNLKGMEVSGQGQTILVKSKPPTANNDMQGFVGMLTGQQRQALMAMLGGAPPPVTTTPKPTTPAPKLAPDMQALKIKMMKSLLGRRKPLNPMQAMLAAMGQGGSGMSGGMGGFGGMGGMGGMSGMGGMGGMGGMDMAALMEAMGGSTTDPGEQMTSTRRGGRRLPGLGGRGGGRGFGRGGGRGGGREGSRRDPMMQRMLQERKMRSQRPGFDASEAGKGGGDIGEGLNPLLMAAMLGGGGGSGGAGGGAGGMDMASLLGMAGGMGGMAGLGGMGGMAGLAGMAGLGGMGGMAGLGGMGAEMGGSTDMAALMSAMGGSGGAGGTGGMNPMEMMALLSAMESSSNTASTSSKSNTTTKESSSSSGSGGSGTGNMDMASIMAMASGMGGGMGGMGGMGGGMGSGMGGAGGMGGLAEMQMMAALMGGGAELPDMPARGGGRARGMGGMGLGLKKRSAGPGPIPKNVQMKGARPRSDIPASVIDPRITIPKSSNTLTKSNDLFSTNAKSSSNNVPDWLMRKMVSTNHAKPQVPVAPPPTTTQVPAFVHISKRQSSRMGHPGTVSHTSTSQAGGPNKFVFQSPGSSGIAPLTGTGAMHTGMAGMGNTAMSGMGSMATAGMRPPGLGVGRASQAQVNPVSHNMTPAQIETMFTSIGLIPDQIRDISGGAHGSAAILPEDIKVQAIQMRARGISADQIADVLGDVMQARAARRLRMRTAATMMG